VLGWQAPSLPVPGLGAGPERPFAYLCRYTHRAAISNTGLISVDTTVFVL
jgi:hypothetical protein